LAIDFGVRGRAEAAPALWVNLVTDSLVNALNKLVYLAFAIALIATPFFLINWIRYTIACNKNRSRVVPLAGKVPTKSIGFFVIPIIVAIVLAEIVTWRSRVEAMNFLYDLPANYKIYVDSQPARQPDKIVAALRTAAHEWGHHSHPTKRISIDIR
jgi:hypothetical protein